MENQHRHIKRYRDLTQDEINMINRMKQNGADLSLAIDALEKLPDVDKRALALARTNLQQGFMWLIRAIARPEGFC